MYMERFLPFIGKCGPLVRHEIEKGLVRRYAESLSAEDLLYYDEDYAATTAGGRITVPPLFYKLFDYGLIPGLADVQPQSGLIHGGEEFQSFKPICAGDVVWARNKVVDVFEKQGKSGVMVFLTRECGIFDAEGNPYCLSFPTAIMKEELFKGGLSIGKQVFSKQQRQPLQAQLFAADFQPGSALPPFPPTEITRAMAINLSSLTNDFNPLHFDDEAARQLGFERSVAHGIIGVSLYLNMVREWFGPLCTVQKLSFSFGVPVLVGDVLSGSGEVLQVEQQISTDLLTCRLELHNSQEQRTCTATLTLAVEK